MIKTALKMNIVLFTLLLIVSMPLVYADWSDLTVTVDTNVVTYDEIAFIQQYRGLYYIEYIGNKPYIRTNDNIYNQYFVTDFTYSAISVYWEIVGDRFYIKPERDNCSDSCYLVIWFRPNINQYYIEFFPYDVDNFHVYGWKNGTSTKIYNIRPYSNPQYVPINDSLNYDYISIQVYSNRYETGSYFSLNVYKSGHVIDYIDRPAGTYVYEHSDYTRIGAIILDSYNNFVDSLLNPLDTIMGWLKELGNYVWSTIKRIIDPEGIFLK